LVVQKFQADLSSGWLLLEGKLCTSLPAILRLSMIRVKFESLFECLFCLLVLLLLFKNGTNIDEGLWVFVVILSGLTVVIESIVNFTLVIVSTGKVEVAFC
jgi:hypothetical protein